MALAEELGTSVGKALALIRAFDSNPGNAMLTELASTAGLPKPTAHRLLGILVASGFVERRGARYALSPDVYGLGMRAVVPDLQAVRDLTIPRAVELSRETRQRVNIAALCGNAVLLVDGVDVTSRKHPARRGQRLPAHASALGKALLAHSPQETVDAVCSSRLHRYTQHTITDRHALTEELQAVRSAGVAVDRQEGHLNLLCIAAPVRVNAVEVLAALSVTGSARDMDLRRAEASVRQAALDISRALTRAAGSAAGPRRLARQPVGA